MTTAQPITLTIRRPDDWHVHFRDDDMLKTVVPYTSRYFGRAIVMPNLVPPITTIEAARRYRDRIKAAIPSGDKFEPLMTCYLTDSTLPSEVEQGFLQGVIYCL
ncbi:dihydroorotase [Proteus mirabilis]|uniref:Dihydroorotase n=1 Tax=Proteus mirabilis TaxID=584 RepID=A0A379GG87_PROMI|nr:dihydroorotase [Proteus mirabilis]